ncbi:unnamed protein product [Caenorhabditis brenneri]
MGTDRDPGDTKPTQPRDPKMQVARILLPDGVYKEFEVNKTAEGEVLFTQVTQNLSIEEREYFSLCFYDNVEGVRHWLYNDKVIAKQIKSLPWEFSFEVKFYPTTPTTIVDDHARYFVFLQLRRDILTGRLPVANADTHALLGSFVAQMEFGDAPSHISNDYEKFITDSKLVPSSHATPETFKKIAELHRELRGQSTGETEIMFLDHCKHLPLYGIHIFKATDKDKKSVDVGIGAAGVNVYQDEQVAHIFNWQNIIKIGYKRTYFSVKVKAGVLENVKDEKTLYYKLPSYVAAKRVWKCAVEHHTFFRLIQPEEKPHKGFFNFESQRFRYQGRTQFQTKIASQMFDKPSTVDRAPSAMSQPIASAEDQKLQTLNLTDSELEQRQFERYRRALTPKSYTSSRQDDDEISTATFAKYSRPSTLLVVNTSQQHQPHDLSYSPRDDSSNYSSAAYYMSERSSLRTPSSAYYPPSEYTSPTSPVYFEGQHSGEYHVQMRQSTSNAGASGASGARRNLFGRASDARSSKASRDSVRLVSFHEPVDPDQPIHRTHPANELQEIPISHTVTMYYHGGAYERLSPRRQQRPDLPYGFGNYTPRNGVSHVDNLQPDGEMDQQPIRFFVDVRHSGASRRDPTKRLSHPGKEDVKEKIDPKDYEFAPASTSDTIHRTELGREVQPANIHQFTRRYHPGQYSQQPDPPQYRLITHVHPLVVSTREESKNGQSSSNVTATISQKEQIVSTKVRRESPDADRRVRLSASVDRSGNLTDTTEEMARSSTTTTEVTTTTTTVVTTAEKKKKKQKIPPSSKKTDETRSRFGGFFTKKTSQKASDYPEGSGEFSGELDTTARTRELEASDFQHPIQVPEYSPKKTAATVVTSSSSPEHHQLKEKKRSLVAVETPEVPKKYRLIARTRHEGEEEVGDKPEAYDFSSHVHEGPVEDIRKEAELVQVPIREYTELKETSPVAGKKQKKVKSPKKTPVPAAPAEPAEPETREIKLIARVRTEPEELVAEPVVKEKKPKKESSSKLGFFSKTTKSSKTTGYPESSIAFTGELDPTDRTLDLEPLPFEHTQTPTTSPHRHHKKFTLFGRLRHEGDEDVVEKPDPYAFESTSYSGPFEETHFEQPLEHVPIEVKHSGESWNWKKSAPTGVPLVKKEKKQKESPVVEEPEKKEIKLIARVISKPEELVDEPVVKEKKPKKESSSKFGFFSKTTKTTTDYPESSAAFTGELDTTDRARDLESSPFEHPDYPAYIPKKGDEEAYQPSEHSSRPDEETVEAPAAYGFPSTSYDGPLETTVLEKDLEHSQPPHTVVVPLKKSKKAKKHVPEPETREVRLVARYLPTEPVVEQPKPKTGFLIKKTTKTTSYPKSTEVFTGELEATSRTEDLENAPFEHQEFTRTITENDPVVTHDIKRYYIRERARHEGEEDVVEKPHPYGFSTDIHVGPLDDIARQAELEHADIKDFTATQYPGESWNWKKPAPVVVPLVKKQKKVKSPEPVETETREVRLVARVVTETEDVEKPKEMKPKKDTSKSKLPTLGFFGRATKTTKTTGYPESSEAYTGELDTTSRSAELEGTSFEHPEYPAYAPKKVEAEAPKVPEVPAEPEKKRYRLIARWRHEGDEDVADKPNAYTPSSTMLDLYEGPLEEIARQSELDHADIKDFTATQYPGESWNYVKPATLEEKEKKVKSPKKEMTPEPIEPEKKEIRLIAHIKQEPEEEPVAEPVREKSPKKSTKITGYPESSEQFSGELDTTSPSHELESSTFEHGEIPAYSPKKADASSTPEKKQKKMKSPKKEKVVEATEPETREIRLIAHVKTEQEEPEPVVEEKKPKKEGPSKFGFFSKTTTTKTTTTTGYPFTSEAYTGELDTTSPSHELESTSFEHGEHPAYLPKDRVVEAVEVRPHSELKRYRLITRLRHEGVEDVVEKPEAYKFSADWLDQYDGLLDEVAHETELEEVPLKDYTTTQYPGESRNWKKTPTPVATLEKKEKSPKKVDEPEDLKTKEIRLKVLVKSEEPAAEPAVKEKKPKKESSSKFGFFSKTTKTTKAAGYPESSEAYTGELDTTGRSNELESSAFEHPEYPVYAPKKNEIQTSVGPSQAEIPEEPEKREIRLKAYVKTEEPVVEPIVKEKKPKKESSKFGFFSKTTKTTKTTGYPETSEAYTGDLDTTIRSDEFEGTSFEHHEYPEYATKTVEVQTPKTPEAPVVPEKKRYRLIARFKHEGDEDVADKPDAYTPSSTMLDLYEGPLDKIARQSELDHADIKDFTATQYPGESWNYKKPSTLEKKEKKIKSPKKEKSPEPEEPETREVRLVARIKSETEEELAPEPIKKKRDSKSALPGFGYFHRTYSTSHPETSEQYTGHLESTGKALELETAPFEHREIPAYSPKQIEVETTEVPAEPEKKRFHWFARWRHEGEEDVTEKPDAYTPSSKMLELYEGPLDEIAPESELGYALISDHSNKYHSGESWNVKKTPTPVATLEKKEKKIKSPKKEKVPEPEEPEVKEIRLIARVKSETEEDLLPEPAVKEKSPKKTAKITGYPEPSEQFSGELDTTSPSHELESSTFEHGEIPAYSPKKADASSTPEKKQKKVKSPKKEKVVEPTEPETREIRLIAHVKTEQEEPEPFVKEKKPKKEKSSKFGLFSKATKTIKTTGYPETSETYTGDLDTTIRSDEFEGTSFEHPKIPEYSLRKADVEAPENAGVPLATEEPEKKKVRLIAYVKPEPKDEEPVEYVKEKKPKKESSSKFGFFSKTTKTIKTTGYPSTSEAYTGELDTTDRTEEFQGTLFEHAETPSKKRSETPEDRVVEKRKYRLITRYRHDGDEDVVEKPEFYDFSPELYSGPLEETSVEIEKPVSPSKKSVKSEKPETREVRLIARVKTQPEEELVAEPAKEKKPKKEATSRFGFFSKTTKTSKATGYPEASDPYAGELDTTDRSAELEGTSFEHPEYPAYAPKKAEDEAPGVSEVPAEPEKKRYRLIARWRHEGEEDVADKPDAYTPSSTMLELYEGPLDEIARQSELDHADIKDFTTAQYPGESWNWKKPAPTVVPLVKEKNIKSPKKEKVEEPEVPETKEIRLKALVKSEPEEEPVAESVKEKKPKKESSSKFGFFSKTTKTTKAAGYPESSEAYTGELDTTDRSAELEGTSFEHPEYPVYAPKKNEIQTSVGPSQAEVPGEPEKKEIRLKAYVKVEEPVEEPIVKEKKPKKEGSSKFGFFSKTTKTTKTTGYPEFSEAYTGDLDTTIRSDEFEGTSFEHPEYPEYAPKTVEVQTPETPEAPAVPEKKRYRLIARFKHEGDEDVADKPDAYTPSSKMLELYEGPLDEIARQSELDHADIKDFTATQYPGESWNYKKPSNLEKKEKKVKSPKKEKSPEPEEQEIREVRLVARIKSETEEELAPEPIKKKRDSKSALPGFGYFHRTYSTSHPETSEQYTGHLESTGKALELETAPFEHKEIPAYSPKQIEVETPEVPAEPEKKRFHWFARWRHEGEEDVAEKPDAYTPSSKMLELYEGPLDEIAPESELGYALINDHSNKYHSGESWNVKKTPTPVATLEKKEKKIKSPKKEKVPEPEEPEVKEVRLIARVKSETEEDLLPEPAVKEKSPKKEPSSKFGFFSKTTKSTKATGYPDTSEAYTGELDTTGRSNELESSAFEHPEYPAYAPKNIESAAPETSEVSAEPEKKEIRLIAYVKPDQPEKPVSLPVVKERKPKKESSSKFGLFSRTTKTAKTTGYPESSEAYTGDLDTTGRSPELESSEFEHPEYPPYKPRVEETTEITGLPEVLTEKKKYRLIARFRHEGEEDVVEKPEAYGFPTDVHVGPIDDIHRVVDLDQVPLGDYLQQTGESWKVEELTTPIATLEKKQKKIKSPKKEKTPEPIEPEKKEIRLIARVRTEPEEPVAEPVVREKKPKKGSSSKFGFFSKTTKTPKTTGYPESSDVFTGELDTTDLTKEFEGTSFEHPEYPTYAPKITEVEAPAVPEVPAEPEKKRYRLIARWRHEGEEDVADKPDAYTPSSKMLELYEGPLDEIARQSELDHADIKDFTATQYPGESWKKPAPTVVTLVKEKKIKSPKKEKLIEPEEPEPKEIRLKVLVKSETEEEPIELAKEKKPKKESSSKFGILSKTTETTKATGYPESSEAFTGDLDTTDLSTELENTSFEHPEYPAYSPKHGAEASEVQEVPAEPEKKRYRLIARFKHEGEEDVAEKPDAYTPSPKMLELYDGPLDEIARQSELDHADIKDFTLTQYPGESWNLKKTPTPVATLEKKEKKIKSPKKEKVVQPVEPEKKEIKLIARVRTEPEEPVVSEKKPKKESTSKFGFFSKTTKTSKTTGYPETSEAYTGELDTTDRSAEFEGTSFEHAEIPAYSPRNAEVETTVVPEQSEKVVVPEEPEKTTVRLIVHVKPQPEEEPVAEPVVKEKKPKKESSKFGFFSKTTKTTKTTGYPETSEAYTGDLDTTGRSAELEESSFEHPEYPAYAPKKVEAEAAEHTEIPTPVVPIAEPEKKRYRLIARFKHEGEEDVVHKPDPYAFDSTLYAGPLEEISRENELDHTPIADHADIRRHEEENVEEPVAPVRSPKKEKKVKSPKKEKIVVSEEPETREIRLKALVKSEPEKEPIAEKPNKKASKTKTPSFAFFSRTTKTTKTTGYPESSEAYSGDLDTTDRTKEFEGISFEHPEYPAYTPKKIEVEAPEVPEVPAEPERKRYRLIARWRHEGDEDVADKPDAYTPSSTMLELYEGPLDEIARESELDHADIKDFTATQYPGESWNWKKIPTPVATLEKKIKSPKKEKVVKPDELETKEIRLKALVKSEPEEEPVESVKDKKPKKESSSKFGFFSKTTRTTKATGYPETAEAYTGELDTTGRTEEFEGTSFEHGEIPAYSAKKIEAETPDAPTEPEKKRYRLIARWKHEGDEDVVDKPETYTPSSKMLELYEGPLDEIARQSELDHADIKECTATQYHGESWNYVKPATLEKKEKKVKSPKKEKTPEPVETEKKEIRLIAYVKKEPEEEPVAEPIKEKKPKKESSSKFGFFSKTTKTTKTAGYPESSEVYTGDLDTTNRSDELEGTSFEHPEYPAYVPKKMEAEAPEVSEVPVEPEKKRYRLIARWKHEGEEDVADKPDAYTPSPSMVGLYEGSLDEIAPYSELDHADIKKYTVTQYPGESWNWKKPAPAVVPLEKEKKIKSPKKEKVVVPEEPETKEIRLKALVKSEPEEPVAEPVVKEKKPKKGSSSKFGFFSMTTKTTKTTGYPESSEAYIGDLDITDRSAEFEGTSFEYPEYPAYAPKKTEVQTPAQPEILEEPEKKIRLIAHVKSEPEEEPVAEPVVKQKKPKKEGSSRFGLFSRTTKTVKTTGYPETSEAYTGELNTTGRTEEFQGTSFEHGEIPAYSPRKVKVEAPEVPEAPAVPEKKRYRLIARFKHEGDEDVVDKPDAYTPSSTMLDLYEGPLDEIARQSELGHADIKDFTATQYPGESWNWKKPSTLEKKEKKIKSPKKETVEEPEEPETKEIRLKALIKSEPEEEPVESVKEKKPKKELFGFFHRSSKASSPTSESPEPAFEGPLDTTIRSDEFESIPFEHSEFTASTPIKAEQVVIEVPEEKKHSRFNWFARWRHEGDEDVVEKPSVYAFSSDVYDGPLEDLYPQGDVDQTLITEYSDVYDYKPYHPKKPVRERVKTPEPEPSDVKLVARIPPMEPEERASPVKDRPRLSSFNIFHRHSKQHHGYPEPTDVFTGDLDVTGRSQDVEKSPFEMRTDYPEYSPKVEPELPAEPPQQSRLHRLFARWRHEGEEDVVEKPDLYKFSSDVYDGPLDEMHPEGEVEQAPLQEHSEVYEYVEYRDGSKKPKSPKTSKKVAEKENTPEPSETHEVKLLTRVKSEEPEEPEVQETTPSKPFRLRFLSLAKKTQDSEYPETSPVYEGPLDLTSRSDEMEPMPYLHGATPRYSPKITPIKRKTPEPTVEKKKYRLIARLRHDGDEDTVEKPEAYGHSTEVYSGELEETHKKQEVEQVPLGEYSDLTEKEVDKKTVRLIARVPPQQESEPKKPASKFRLFPLSKSSSSSKGYPATSPTYEGPLDVTGRVKPLDHVPLEAREIPAYSPRKATVSEEKAPEEPKRYRLIARFKHEGDEDVVEKPEGYIPSSKMLELYEGPFDEISRDSEVEQTSLSGTVDVIYDVDNLKVEKRQKKKKRSEVPDVPDSDEQEMEPKSRFSFLRTQKPRSQVTSYPSSSYSGPLDTTNLNMDLENIPLTIPEPIIQRRVPRKYRLIHRHRHAGEEDEVAAHNLHPAFYSFPVTRHSGEIEVKSREEELPELPLRRFSRVYHSGSSATLIWNLLNPRSSRASRELEDARRPEPKKEVKLIARVLPMKKTPEKEVKPEKLTKEEQEAVETLTRSAELMDTSRTLTSGLNAINYIPSSLQYNPRPARIEGTTEDGDCYVEIRHERRAEVQLEPAYVLRETTARSHAYLSTATAVFSGVSASSSGAQASSSSTSHSLVLPSFVGSVSEDETGLHHFSWTPQQMSPQPERMSLLARLGFKRDKSKKKDKKKSNKKGENDTSGETSDSEHDEKREFAVVEFEQHAPTHNKQDPSPPKKPEHRTQKSPGRRADEPMNEVTVVVTSSERPKELKNTKEVRHETREQQFRLTGDGYTSGFNPNDPSLMATIQRAERLNASSPRLEHAERTFTVRANAPLPVSFEESGQPYTTVSTWQETSDLPEQVEVYTDENGRQITRTVKSSQVKHTVQTQSFQNYIVDGDQVPVGVVDVERSREQLTPLGQKASSSSSTSNGGANGVENGGDSSGIVETQTRTMTYEAQGGENAAPPGWAEQGLGEYVSSKSVTQGNRTIETITYKTEKDGVVETHVEHRVTIHSDGDIDHDAELSQAILEATQMNPDMVVEKIEVRQETTQ